MLSQAIYQNTRRDIKDLATKYTAELREKVNATTHVQLALRQAFQTATSYHSELVPLVYKRLQEVGMNAAAFYGPDLTTREQEQEVSAALDTLTHSRYYGLTLPQRLAQSHHQLKYNMRRSAVTGAKQETRLLNITRVFNEVYPYGAHQSWDTRLFLAEAVRLEHEMAKRLGSRQNISLVRWTVSHNHSQEDICDQLSLAVDPLVQTYIEFNHLKVDPVGVYFLEDIPHIPHPNCQCVIKFIRKKPRVQGPKKPEKTSRKSLIKRIISSIFKRI